MVIRNLSTAGLAIIAVSMFFWIKHSHAALNFFNSCAQTRFPAAVIPGSGLIGVNGAKLRSKGGRHVFVSGTIWDVNLIWL